MTCKKQKNTLFAIVMICSTCNVLAEQKHEHTHSAVDQRQIIRLSPEERHFMLSEMRQFLVNTQKILQANQQGNMTAVATAARQSGMVAHKADMANPNSLMHQIRKKVPAAFFPLGKATHEAFDTLADTALSTGNRDEITRLLTENLQRCAACHDNYQVQTQ